MISPLYSALAATCALVVLIFISKPKDNPNSQLRADKAYNSLNCWIVAFCLFDCFWGLAAGVLPVNNGLLFALSSVFHLLAAVMAYQWLDYVLVYLDKKVRKARIIRMCGLLLVFLQVVLLAVNIRQKNLFYVNDSGCYVELPERNMLFICQYAVYALVGMAALIQAVKEGDWMRNQYSAVVMFVIAPVVCGICQIVFPEAPCVSIGYMLGSVIIFTYVVTLHDEQRRMAILRAEQESKDKHNFMVIANLSEDFDCINYIKKQECKLDDIVDRYRYSDEIIRMIPGVDKEESFSKQLDLIAEYFVLPDDREKFISGTRRNVILTWLQRNPVYFVNFRSRDGRYSQLKFSADIIDGEVVGFITGLHYIDEESNRLLTEQRVNDVISVLSTEYNAVYYCRYADKDYDILFQQGFVKKQLRELKEKYNSYPDAFNYYISTLVHPDDRDMMRKELEAATDVLQTNKRLKVEFRRLYGDKYLYTEMHCVKVEEADEPLHNFVVGFAENDATYRIMVEQQKQLEYIVTERTAELQSRNRTLNKINEDIIELLGNITEARDLESGQHIRRVKGFTHILAEQVMKDWPEYGLTKDDIELITSASALHDIGKIAIPDSILLKPDRLTKEEFDIMKTHCDKGCDILQNSPEDWSAAYVGIGMDICRYHHERWDGKGYPKGLVGDDIPVSAQIVAVADVFDALISDRPYKEAFSKDTAFDMILHDECGVFSEKIKHSFIAVKEEMFAQSTENSSNYTSSMAAGISTGSLSRTRMLFADDNEISRELGMDILREEGAEVVGASGGREALRIFENSVPGYFDALIIDTVMPDMSGPEVSALIRGMNRSDAGTVPIIALASFANEDDIQRCMVAGMNSFVTKPISIASLNKVLYECLRSDPEALKNAVLQADREASERIDRVIRKNSFLTGIVNEYDFICYVNGGTNHVSGFRCNEDFERVLSGINPGLPSNRRLDRFFMETIPQREFKEFLEKVDRSRVLNHLKTASSFQIIVTMAVNGKPETPYRLVFHEDSEIPGNFILYLQSLNAESRAEIRARQLINILAESYVIVDYIDLEKDSFTRYQEDKDYHGPDRNNGSYSTALENNIYCDIHPDDKARMFEFFNAEHLRTQLRTNKSISAKFRGIRNGLERNLEVQFINARDDSDARYAILTLSDIDDMVRKEKKSSELLKEARNKLIEAERRANRDGLTGVKNIFAYTDMVSAISEGIKYEDEVQFAAVVCDMNNLKQVNDTYGHNAGDMYIKNGCTIICEVFENSTVYRIGGDEFVVILTGSDYENRDALMGKLHEKVSEAEEKKSFRAGKTGLSAGMAVFRPNSDKGVVDVVRRADWEMYKDKRNSKGEADNALQ